jgi:HEAT repeat protein
VELSRVLLWFSGVAFASALLLAAAFVLAKTWSGWQAHSALVARASLEQAAGERAVRTFAKLARRFPFEAYEVLGRRLPDPAAQELFETVGGLTRLRRLASSRPVRRRVQAAALLGMLPFCEESSCLLRSLVVDPHPLVREAAARAVASRADAPAAAEMLAAMQRYRDLRIYRLARHALRRCGSNATGALIRGSSSSLPEVRWLCLDVLGDIGDPPALAHILQHSEQAEGDTETLIRVARALRNYSGAHVISRLLELATHPAWEVRAQAARSLGLAATRGPSGADCVDAVVERLKQLTTDPEYWVRNNAALALAGLGERGRRALEELASGADCYAAERALEALTRMARPRVTTAGPPLGISGKYGARGERA